MGTVVVTVAVEGAAREQTQRREEHPQAFAEVGPVIEAAPDLHPVTLFDGTDA